MVKIITIPNCGYESVADRLVQFGVPCTRWMASQMESIVMATKKFVVSGDQRLGIADKCWEIQRQLKLANGSPLDPRLVDRALQGIIEGRFNAAQSDRPAEQKPTSTILETVTTVSLPAIEAFSAKTYFVTKNTPDGVSLGWLGDNFQRHFLGKNGKCELDVSAAELRMHRLKKRSVDESIIKELGGEQVAETHLAHMWEMMKQQGQGQQGDLLVNGYATFFYIRASDGTLWAVYCSWNAYFDDWYVEAYSITQPYGWDDGRQVVSC